MRAKWTDLAVEAAGGALRENGLSRTVVKVENEESAQKLGRPMGTYITLACEQAMTVSLETRRALAAELAQTLRGMLPPDMKTALVVGLGNRSVTPDSLGPRTAERVLVTRHMGDCLPRDVPMSSVCAAAPGVLGVTGMETAEILRGMVAHVKPELGPHCLDAPVPGIGHYRGFGRGQPPQSARPPDARRARDRRRRAAGGLCFDHCFRRALRIGRRRSGGRAHCRVRGARRFRKAGGDDRHAARCAWRACWRTASIRRCIPA